MNLNNFGYSPGIQSGQGFYIWELCFEIGCALKSLLAFITIIDLGAIEQLNPPRRKGV